jgi:hypothetical protein
MKDITKIDKDELIAAKASTLAKRIDDEQLRLQRAVSLLSDKQLKEVNSRFALHVGEDGKPSSGHKGMMMAINTTLKKEFGFSVNDHLNKQQITSVSTVRLLIADFLETMNGSLKNRKDISQTVINIIKQQASLYHTLYG